MVLDLHNDILKVRVICNRNVFPLFVINPAPASHYGGQLMLYLTDLTCPGAS